MSSYEHEHDPRWSAVDHYNWSHLHATGTPSPDVLEKILKASKDSGLPAISVSPAQGKFLQIQAKLIQAKNIVEVGLLGGYSTVWLATSSSEVKVTSLEIDPTCIKVAKENFDLAGVSDRIEVIEGPAIETFPKLVQDVKNGRRPRVDLVFIDANKQQNLEYFNFALEMAHPGTLIIIDNVVRQARVVDPNAQNDPIVIGTRSVIESVGNNPRINATIIQMVGEKSYDGMLISVLRE